MDICIFVFKGSKVLCIVCILNVEQCLLWNSMFNSLDWVVLMIYIALTLLQSYRDKRAGDTEFQKT